MNFKKQQLSFFTFFVGFLLISAQLYSQKYNQITYKIIGGESVEDAKLNLQEGSYQMSLKVWVEPNAYIEGIKTTIKPIGKSLVWEFEDIEIGKWVTLTNEFSIDNSVEGGLLIIQLIEDTIFGVGEGNFYIDDIAIVLKANEVFDDKFTIQTTGETCADKNNGTIEIDAGSTENYAITLNGIHKSTFSDKTILENINPGEYVLCIFLAEKNFERCFNVKIEEGNTISGKASIKANKASVQIEKGTPPFNVKINGETVLETQFYNFEINVLPGDLLEVSTTINCEGVFAKNVDMLNDILVYPNPVSSLLYIKTPINSTVLMHNSLGSLVKRIEKSNGFVIIDTSNLSKGLYTVNIINNENSFKRKIIIR
ncbi:T9SS type A sorting domain-containing protein [Lutibacter citreus]|uniref:T9SS type A sorting domain-containing protein n=1 Tax=Lutibacter citreus TaxID=2138210 RepID=UPI000DBE14D4|nr:T9SS type A sorting domain-containing protein [Lutibacter citreus]